MITAGGLTASAKAYIYGLGTTPAEQANLATGTVTYPRRRLTRVGPRHRQQLRHPNRDNQLRRLGQPPDHRWAHRHHPLSFARSMGPGCCHDLGTTVWLRGYLGGLGQALCVLVTVEYIVF